MKSLCYNTLEKVILVMQAATKTSKPFNVAFVKLDGSIAYIDKAALGKRSLSGSNKYYLPLINLENKERRKAFITSILSVNNIPVNLNK